MPPVKMRGTARPENTKKTISRILQYMGKFKSLWILVFLCVVVNAAADIICSYAIKPVLNDYIIPMIGSEDVDLTAFIRFLGTIAVIFGAGVLASWGNSRLMLYISTNLLCKIRTDLFNRLETLPVKYFDAHTHGELMSRFTNDTDTLRDMLSQTVPQLMSSAISITGVFIMMMVLSPLLTVIMIVTILIMMAIAGKISKKSAESYRENQKNIGKLNGYIEEIIEGQKVVKVFNHEQEAMKTFQQLNDNLCNSGTKANSYGNILGPLMGNLSHVQYGFVAVAGAFFIITGPMDVGTVAAFLQYTRSFSRPVTMISQLFNSILNALAGAERIFNIIDEKPEDDSGYYNLVNATEYRKSSDSDEKVLSQSFAYTGQWAWKDSVNGLLVPLKGKVEFKNVTFGYRDDKTVLHDITIHAEPGKKIALVGSTGSGKTTITNLLTRFYDLPEGSGEILYDGIPVKKICKDDLRRSLGMVLQDTHLFTGTIYENIKYGNLDISRKQVYDAAELANATTFINHLEKGFDTVISGDGAGLSQGERQLLAIARAAVKNPPVLILDEATSSIDTRTESLIQKGMDSLMKGRTVFVIAHRLSTVRNADEIIVLEKGKILERGNHEQLMAEKGKYYQLYTGSTLE